MLFMTRAFDSQNQLESAGAQDERSAALDYVTEAFAEAVLSGVDGESFAHAALFAALQELVFAYGEDETAVFAARLPDRIAAGEFTTGFKH
jgi:hypothetical protein